MRTSERREIRSIIRPTVATTTWAPARSRDCWVAIGAPPKTATISIVEVLGVGAQRLGHLDAELAGRGQDDRLDLVVGGVEVLQQRQAEGGGLAGAGLRLADHVVAGEQLRDRLLLDRGRLVVAELVERLLGSRRREAELCEGRLHALTATGSRSSLPLVRRAVEVLVRAARLRQRVDAADDDLELAGGDGRRSSSPIIAATSSRRREQVHEPEADHDARASQQVAGRDLVAARARRSRRRPCARTAPASASVCVEGSAAAHLAGRRRPARRRWPRGSPPRGPRRASRRSRRRRAARPARASPRSRRGRSPGRRRASRAARRACRCRRRRPRRRPSRPVRSRAQRWTSASAVRPWSSSAAAWSSETSSGIGTSARLGDRDLLGVAAGRRGSPRPGARRRCGRRPRRRGSAAGSARRGSRCGSRGCRRS